MEAQQATIAAVESANTSPLVLILTFGCSYMQRSVTTEAKYQGHSCRTVPGLFRRLRFDFYSQASVNIRPVMPITVLSYSGVIDHFAAACPVGLLDKPKVQKDSKNRHIGFGLDFQDKQKVLFFAL